MIRFFDILLSLLGLIILGPVFILTALWIKFDSKGPVFYRQRRVGRYNDDFVLLKFRSMYSDSERHGLLTVGNNDLRITRSGRYIRNHKIDELPQLINVLKGDMSMVGPRPEVRKYVDLYNDDQKKILMVRPGITDFASIKFANENEILGKVEDPERYYVDVLMPEKLKLNLRYTENRNLLNYFSIIFRTLFSITED